MNRLSKLWLPLTFFKKGRETFFLYIFFMLINKLLNYIISGKSMCIFFVAYGIFQFLKSYIYWKNYKYEVNKDNISLIHGYFIKHSKIIYFDQIKETNEYQPILYKPFNLYSLSLYTESNTYGGSIQLELLSQKQLLTIYKKLYKKHPSNLSSTHHYDYVVSQKLLFLGSFSILNLLFFYLILDSFSNKLKKYLKIDFDLLDFWNQALSSTILLLLFLIIYMFLGIVFNYMKTLLTYGNHKVQISDKNIQIQKGVLKYTQETITKERIQALIIKSSLIQRFFNITKVEIISNKGEKNSEKVVTNVIFPFVHKNNLEILLFKLLPDFNSNLKLKKISKKSILFKLSRPIIVLIPIYYLVKLFFPVFLKIYTLLFIIIILGQLISGLFTKYSLNSDYIVFRKFNIVTNMYIIPNKNIEEFSYTQSFMHRCMKLSNLKLIIRRPSRKYININDISIEDVYRFYIKNINN
ncbi:PH domain-containing protein [Staphylococcus pseudintermedius]|uniref:PH domain-containing protein n=1 Tax=Staphylococcus pseudintermedius TaxID=283734 RepID=UPI002883DC86|nr:PH domain-containing protein [Staphylococcus pseudintermedius]MDT0977883.1 PH domain-containing protein [Staphylococcus pseudintermedius]